VDSIHAASEQKSSAGYTNRSMPAQKSPQRGAIPTASTQKSGATDAPKASALYAQHGECAFCDARRAYAAASMRRSRKKPVT
jgi:hypothetical protein